MNELDGIKQFTTVVADSGDIESIRHYHPRYVTTIFCCYSKLPDHHKITSETTLSLEKMAIPRNRWSQRVTNWQSFWRRNSQNRTRSRVNRS